MTDQEWLSGDDPQQMLQFLGAIPTDRKLRLFAVACCSRCADILADPRHSRLVTVVELLADNLTTTDARRDARDCLFASNYALWAATQEDAFASALRGSQDIALHVSQGGYDLVGSSASLEEKLAAVDTEYQKESIAQVELLRDIFGNPFSPVAFSPSWRTTDVMLLAQGIYDEKAFDRMPILADALHDAGCDSDDILNHCRDTTATHVRGCWVVDLVLGKS